MIALDRDADALALAAGPGITVVQADLEEEGAVWPFTPGRFAGIVVTNYLHRPLMAQIAASLKPDGVLIYETFAAGNEAFGKPSNPAFLLARGELLAHARRASLAVLAFEDGYCAAPKPARRMASSRVFASPIALSFLMRSMRGKRTAMPDLWRGERWMPSNPSSNTSSGFTVRTGPKRSTVLRRTKLSSHFNSSSVKPK